jgi:leader peptidase (prepilin peptidase)/N-methyltransferase
MPPVVALALPLTVLYVVTAVPAVAVNEPELGAKVALVTLASLLIALSVVDIREHRLPNIFTIPLAGLGLCLSILLDWGDTWMRVVAGCAGFASLYAVALVYRYSRGRDGLGLGDAKLLAASGVWLGVEALPSVLLLASAGGLLSAAGAVLRGRGVSLNSRIAFGPFLAFATWLVWLYGPIAL